MYSWEIVEGSYHPIPMGGPEFGKSPNMKMVLLVIQITRVMRRTGKAEIMDSGFCVLKLILETMKRGVCVSVLIKIGDICLKGFMEALLTINSGPKYWVCGMYKL